MPPTLVVRVGLRLTVLTDGRTLRPVRRIAILTLALAILWTASAEANRHRNRMTFSLARTVAIGYWAKHGIKVPCYPRALVYTYADLADQMARDRSRGVSPYIYAMWADVDLCIVKIPPWTDPLKTVHDTAWIYCQEVVHEIGHIAGLEHTYGGVMRAQNGRVPWGCDHPAKFRRRYAATNCRRDGFAVSARGRRVVLRVLPDDLLDFPRQRPVGLRVDIHGLGERNCGSWSDNVRARRGDEHM